MLIAVIYICISCAETGKYTDESSAYTGKSKVSVLFSCKEAETLTKSLLPDEYLLSDINLLIFNKSGLIEERKYFEVHGHSGCYETELLKGSEYSLYICANLGYELECNTIEELVNAKCYMAYPDDYRTGMPMCGKLLSHRIDGSAIEIPLERMMAKISLCIDRRKLDNDVSLYVRSVKAFGCPKSAFLFKENTVEDKSDFFPSGFICSEYDTDPLNTVGKDGKSGKVNLFILENKQGELLPENRDESAKFFKPGDTRGITCSYIEIKMEYISDNLCSKPGGYLIYRFYPGENPSNFDITRNKNYRITILPQGNGLSETSWRIDTDDIEYRIEDIQLSYDELRLNYLGEKIDLKAYLYPETVSTDEINLHWESSNSQIATTDPEGRICAIGKGRCTITCRVMEKPSVVAECNITVDPSPYYMRVYPGNYIHCHAGDIIEISCDYFPPNAPFNIGLEELETDRKRGIYDYEISEDGKKVTLTTLKRGSGLLYMETGAPVDQAELIVIVID